MSAFVLHPDDDRVAWLRDRIANCPDGVDTASTLDPDDPDQMVHIGADLWVPTTMTAFGLHADGGDGPAIEAIEVDYDAANGDFDVAHLLLGGVNGTMLRQLPLERLKRRVIGMWILRDRGDDQEDGGPRWESWRGVTTPRASRRGASRLDLVYTARVYCAARYGEGDAHEAVARAFSISKATAGRWIAKARAEGLMDGIEL